MPSQSVGGAKTGDPREKSHEHTFFYEFDDIFNVIETHYFLCDREFGAQFHSLCSVSKCLFADIVDQYKCVFTNSPEYVLNFCLSGAMFLHLLVEHESRLPVK